MFEQRPEDPSNIGWACGPNGFFDEGRVGVIAASTAFAGTSNTLARVFKLFHGPRKLDKGADAIRTSKTNAKKQIDNGDTEIGRRVSEI